MINIFGYFEDVPTNGREWWGCYYDSIKTALTEISQIQDLPNDFEVNYIKQKYDFIRVEYENAGDKKNQVDEILHRLEERTICDTEKQKYDPASIVVPPFKRLTEALCPNVHKIKE